jgi:CRISPR system Cascade subunit CasD
MSTFLLRLTAPMQCWGYRSRFRERDSGLEPTKSGVIGLLCAALGRMRDEPVDDLAALQMGVRVDREGILRNDYHTTGGDYRIESHYGVPKADGGKPETVLSNRHYLADAEFLVGLEGDAGTLRSLEAALRRPATQLFFGRKSFLPGAPVLLPEIEPWAPRVRDESLLDVLRGYPWLGGLDRPGRRPKPDRVRIIYDMIDRPTHDMRSDVPISFAERTFSSRYVETEWIALPELEGVA